MHACKNDLSREEDQKKFFKKIGYVEWCSPVESYKWTHQCELTSKNLDSSTLQSLGASRGLAKIDNW